MMRSSYPNCLPWVMELRGIFTAMRLGGYAILVRRKSEESNKRIVLMTSCKRKIQDSEDIVF